jgi:Tol biopolymer transport system component
MGEVFRARDTRLGREVAIKALPAAFAQDPERLARFEREAKLLASLSHANIAGIHGLEEHDGRRYLILEFVDGETLAGRLSRGPLALDEAAEVARDVALALEAAHESGIVHRDLKPGNIMVTHAGAVKVLDFGLAKSAAPGGSSSSIALSASPTMTYAATAEGIVLGTAAYMSPEQARGKNVDRRTDIWSFGCVLFECLTARPVFSGETVSDLVAHILQSEPDWSVLPAATPAAVRRLLERCLRKDARERLRDIGDARIELDELLTAGLSGSGLPPVAGTSPVGGSRRSRSTAIAWGVAAVALALAGVSILFPDRVRRSAPPPAARTTLASREGMEISSNPADAVISPDGRSIVFVAGDSAGTQRLWLRPLESLEARPIEGSEFTGATDSPGLPFWSPDGRAIGFFDDGKLKTIAITGGTPQILSTVSNARGGTWSRQGVILFSRFSQGPVFRVSQAGGDPVQITVVDSTLHETAHRFPRFLPDGRHYSFVTLPGRDGKIDTWIGELGTTKRTLVVSAASGALFAPSGHMVFMRGQSLMAQPFDLGRLRMTGEPTLIGDAPENLNILGSIPASVSDNGILLYPTSIQTVGLLSWFGRDGKAQGTLPAPAGDYREIAISPDGRHVALIRRTSPTSNDIWIADVPGGSARRLTTDGLQRYSLVWSGNSLDLGYALSRGGEFDFWQRAASGSDEERPLFVTKSPLKNLSDISRDGSYLVYDDIGRTTQRDIWVLPLEGDRKPVQYLATPFNEVTGTLSPDGRWMLYQSEESGRPELYVQSFPTPGSKVRISTDGGNSGRWRRDGAEIVYRSQRGLMSVTVAAGVGFAAGEPKLLMPIPREVVSLGLTPDFQRCLMALTTGDARRTSLTLLTNWTSLLGR